MSESSLPPHQTSPSGPVTAPAPPPPATFGACLLYTIWLFRYPRLLGRIWRGQRGDPPADTLLDPVKLEAWLDGADPQTTTRIPVGFTVRTDPDLKDGFVLRANGLVLPVPNEPNAAYVEMLAEHAVDPKDQEALSNAWFATPWAVPLGDGMKAEAMAQAQRGPDEWALSTRALADLETIFRDEIQKAWIEGMHESRILFAQRINARLADDPRYDGFRVYDDPNRPALKRSQMNLTHYPSEIVFEPRGALIRTCPTTWTMDAKGVRVWAADECMPKPCDVVVQGGEAAGA